MYSNCGRVAVGVSHDRGLSASNTCVHLNAALETSCVLQSRRWAYCWKAEGQSGNVVSTEQS